MQANLFETETTYFLFQNNLFRFQKQIILNSSGNGVKNEDAFKRQRSCLQRSLKTHFIAP